MDVEENVSDAHALRLVRKFARSTGNESLWFGTSIEWQIVFVLWIYWTRQILPEFPEFIIWDVFFINSLLQRKLFVNFLPEIKRSLANFCHHKPFTHTIQKHFLNLISVDIGNFTFLATISEFVVLVEDGAVIMFDQVRINVGDNYNPTTGIHTG